VRRVTIDELNIRPAFARDGPAIWRILEPILRAGETYALPRDWPEAEAVGFWMGEDHEAFVAEEQGRIVGTYYLHPNQHGGGDHIVNCGYATAAEMAGRGVATAMCRHSLQTSAARGFRAMQFNFVVSTNENAVRLWLHLGFSVVGTIPEAFRHPRLGLVDAFVMHRQIGRQE
jgi:RimJ/RimL family protein N-acetyltransferase